MKSLLRTAATTFNKPAHAAEANAFLNVLKQKNFCWPNFDEICEYAEAMKAKLSPSERYKPFGCLLEVILINIRPTFYRQKLFFTSADIQKQLSQVDYIGDTSQSMSHTKMPVEMLSLMADYTVASAEMKKEVVTKTVTANSEDLALAQDAVTQAVSPTNKL